MRQFLIVLLLVISQRQFFDESIPGLGIDDKEKTHPIEKQFYDDEIDYPSDLPLPPWGILWDFDENPYPYEENDLAHCGKSIPVA